MYKRRKIRLIPAYLFHGILGSLALLVDLVSGRIRMRLQRVLRCRKAYFSKVYFSAKVMELIKVGAVLSIALILQ